MRGETSTSKSGHKLNFKVNYQKDKDFSLDNTIATDFYLHTKPQDKADLGKPAL